MTGLTQFESARCSSLGARWAGGGRECSSSAGTHSGLAPVTSSAWVSPAPRRHTSRVLSRDWPACAWRRARASFSISRRTCSSTRAVNADSGTNDILGEAPFDFDGASKCVDGVSIPSGCFIP